MPRLQLAAQVVDGSPVPEVSSSGPMQLQFSKSFDSQVSRQDGHSESFQDSVVDVSGAVSSSFNSNFDGSQDGRISVLEKPLGPFAFGVLFSAVLNITAIIGAGILSLPHAMAALGWGPGIIFLLLSLAITYFSLWQLVEMHEEKKVDDNGVTRTVTYKRYQDLARRAWGKRGTNLVASMQLVVFVGVSIVYMVAGGLCLLNVYKLLACHYRRCEEQIPALWIFVFSSAQFVLSHGHGFKSLFPLSLLAAVMSISYSAVIFIATLGARDVRLPPELKPVSASTLTDFSALGAIAFAYAGHNVVLEIQSSIPTSKEMPSSKRSMLCGVTIAYLVVGVCYLAVAMSGYAAFEDYAAVNVLGTFAYGACYQASLAETKYKAWTVAANIMVAVHLTGTYQIFAMPVYLQVEKVLKENFKFVSKWSNHWQISYRIVVRSSYVLFTFIMAVLLPDFNNLLGILGGFAFAPTTYFLPCLLWLHILKPTRWSWMWIVNWIIVVFGGLLMVLSFVGSFVQFINNVEEYDQYWAFNKGCPVKSYVMLRNR